MLKIRNLLNTTECLNVTQGLLTVGNVLNANILCEIKQKINFKFFLWTNLHLVKLQ